jgi:hypothetical protein
MENNDQIGSQVGGFEIRTQFQDALFSLLEKLYSTTGGMLTLDEITNG